MSSTASKQGQKWTSVDVGLVVSAAAGLSLANLSLSRVQAEDGSSIGGIRAGYYKRMPNLPCQVTTLKLKADPSGRIEDPGRKPDPPREPEPDPKPAEAKPTPPEPEVAEAEPISSEPEPELSPVVQTQEKPETKTDAEPEPSPPEPAVQSESSPVAETEEKPEAEMQPSSQEPESSPVTETQEVPEAVTEAQPSPPEPLIETESAAEVEVEVEPVVAPEPSPVIETVEKPDAVLESVEKQEETPASSAESSEAPPNPETEDKAVEESIPESSEPAAPAVVEEEKTPEPAAPLVQDEQKESQPPMEEVPKPVTEEVSSDKEPVAQDLPIEVEEVATEVKPVEIAAEQVPETKEPSPDVPAVPIVPEEPSPAPEEQPPPAPEPEIGAENVSFTSSAVASPELASDSSSPVFAEEDAPYLLVGAGTASFAAFRAIKAKEPTAKIVIVGEEVGQTPYMRPPLSKELWFPPAKSYEEKEKVMKEEQLDPEGKDIKFPQWNGKEKALHYQPDQFFVPYEELKERKNGGVSVISGVKVDRIDPDKQLAYLSNGQTLTYGKCLIATAVPDAPRENGDDEAALQGILQTTGANRLSIEFGGVNFYFWKF